MNSKLLITLSIVLCLFAITITNGAHVKQGNLANSIKILNKITMKQDSSSSFNLQEMPLPTFEEQEEEDDEYYCAYSMDNEYYTQNWATFNWDLVKGWNNTTPGGWWNPSVADDSAYIAEFWEDYEESKTKEEEGYFQQAKSAPFI